LGYEMGYSLGYARIPNSGIAYPIAVPARRDVAVAAGGLDVRGHARPRTPHAVALTTMGVVGNRLRHSCLSAARSSGSRVAT